MCYFLVKTVNFFNFLGVFIKVFSFGTVSEEASHFLCFCGYYLFCPYVLLGIFIVVISMLIARVLSLRIILMLGNGN